MWQLGLSRCPQEMKRQKGLETLVGVAVGALGLGTHFYCLSVSAGHLCSVAPKAQLGPTGVSQETDSKLKLRAGLLSDKSTALGLGQP